MNRFIEYMFGFVIGVAVTILFLMFISMCHAETMLIPPVSAETVPPGCYVADSVRTDPCWDTTTDSYNWYQYQPEDDTYAYYGNPIGGLLLAYFEKRRDVERLQQDLRRLKRKCGKKCRRIL